MNVLRWVGVVLLAGAPVAMLGASVYTQKPEDAAAVYLTRAEFGVHGDGLADDSVGLQKAIDRVEETTRQGIVFVPEGRYRISRTIYVWPGVRLIGYGAERPVIVLGANTPGFQDGVAYMMFFAGGRPGAEGMRRRGGMRPMRAMRARGPFPGTVPVVEMIDASPGTFYSAISNIDFEIGEGNAGAVGIRFHAAQHCFMTHMDFHIGSGYAAMKDVGNEAEDLHFHGGRFGIVTEKPSPGWQFTLLDSSFDGQREAAIDEHEAGLTLVHDAFSDVPTVVSIDAGYADELWMQHVRMEDVSGPAIVISNENNARTEIHAEDVVCRKVPVLAHFRESGKNVAGPAETYAVREFSHGLTVELGGRSEIATVFKSEILKQLPKQLPAVIRSLPEASTWVNLKSLGAKGDGVTDDTDAILAAIRDHATIYVPSGRYLVTRTILLKPDTVLIGLHPSTTQFDLADKTPAFDGVGGPVALLETPPGGTNIVRGIGLYANGINRRAVGAMWKAGADSLMDDVRFLGGHGTNNADGTRVNPYNNDHSADPDILRRWDAQYPSLWVLDGGGGTFADIWTPDTFAQAGMYVSDTQTPGRVYELSSEHHVRTEVKLERAANWEIVALQTEEEHGEGQFALPLEIDHSKNVLVANMHSYRVVGMKQTFPDAVRVEHSKDVRFYNLHVDSDSKVSFNDSVMDEDRGVSTRFRELATLVIPDTETVPAEGKDSVAMKRVATGFFNISGATVDAAGRVYFVDARWQKIYRWSPAKGLETLRDSPMDATNLAIDRAGDLMVVSYDGDGTVYSFKPDAPLDELAVLKPQPGVARAGMDAYLPNDQWKLGGSREQPEASQTAFQYVSPDGTTFLPASEGFVQGQLYYGTKMSNVLRSFALAKAEAGKPFYLTDEEEHKTFVGTVGADGSLAKLKLFAERGGESVVAGPDGRVYVAEGEIFVYSPDGKLLRSIDTPERPIDLIFGGKDGRTLFVLARTSLYAMRLGTAK
ncbi:MAG: glycosyl hydrolase family 28-related protein [Acidobacteriaceae bacterium]